MRTITFYSYKGGVGRTLAATNFAVYLAKLGQTTVIVDFDLEAPGVDSKFPNLPIPPDHRGVLDYILDYQNGAKDPCSIRDLAIEVVDEAMGPRAPLWLLPAGDYLSPTYYRRLNQLDWNLVFSNEKNGVEFFQEFVRSIEREFAADFLIIDSRTGIGEIAGLCTQVLPDEVVMLSSLASESIKVTKHIEDLIRRSSIAEVLGKAIDIKVVVTRVPKPENLERLKERCSELLGVEATKLFFLFSSPALEEGEFIALASPERDADLVAGYVRLFYGLNVQVADEAIRMEIERAAGGLLSRSPEESEKAIHELVALYPHPEVYRTAMRFYRLVNKVDRMRSVAWRLLDFAPDDEETQELLGASYLVDRVADVRDRRGAVRALEPLWRRGRLAPPECVRFADMLEDVGRFSEALEIAKASEGDESLGEEVRVRARSIAARCALRAGKPDIARELIPSIPEQSLYGDLAKLAVELRREAGEDGAAFDLTLQILRQHLDPDLMLVGARLGKQLDRFGELEPTIRASEEFNVLRIRRPYAVREISQVLRRIGLPLLAKDLP